MPANTHIAYDASLLFQHFNEMYEQLLQIGRFHKLDEPLQRELIHELFVSFYTKQTDLASVTNPSSYIITAYKRKIIDHFRNQENPLFELTDRDFPLTIVPSHESITIEKERVKEYENLLTSCYNKLPNRCKKVIYYKFYCDMTMEQIQQVTGWSHQSVYNNLSTALKMLKQLFQSSSVQVVIKGISIALLFLSFF